MRSVRRRRWERVLALVSPCVRTQPAAWVGGQFLMGGHCRHFLLGRSEGKVGGRADDAGSAGGERSVLASDADAGVSSLGEVRKPTVYTPLVGGVGVSIFVAQAWFFIEDHKEMKEKCGNKGVAQEAAVP